MSPPIMLERLLESTNLHLLTPDIVSICVNILYVSHLCCPRHAGGDGSILIILLIILTLCIHTFFLHQDVLLWMVM